MRKSHRHQVGDGTKPARKRGRPPKAVQAKASGSACHSRTYTLEPGVGQATQHSESGFDPDTDSSSSSVNERGRPLKAVRAKASVSAGHSRTDTLVPGVEQATQHSKSGFDPDTDSSSSSVNDTRGQVAPSKQNVVNSVFLRGTKGNLLEQPQSSEKENFSADQLRELRLFVREYVQEEDSEMGSITMC
ncbi:hypothetical protein B566_EDAN017884, partial [Ephemera danica]